MNVGDRVGAILSMTDTTVHLLGYGTYQGDADPLGPDATPFILRSNPKILLDDGRVVWGYQVWWGEEAKIRRLIAGRQIVDVKGPVEVTGWWV